MLDYIYFSILYNISCKIYNKKKKEKVYLFSKATNPPKAAIKTPMIIAAITTFPSVGILSGTFATPSIASPVAL